MVDPGEFDTQAPGAPDAFSLGILRIDGLRRFPGTFTYAIGDSGQLVFFLDGRVNAAKFTFWAGMYHLGRKDAGFEDDLAFFRQREKAFKIPGHKAFDPSILALDCPPRWKHDAYQVRPKSGPGRSITHTYAGPRRAAIIRYMLSGPAIPDFPPFLAINRGLEFLSKGWVVQKNYVRLAPDQTTSDAPLKASVVSEIDAAIDRGREYLKLSSRATPAKTQEAVYNAVDSILAGKKLPKAKRDDLAIDLGCVWGQAVCDALKWDWCEVTRDGSKVFAIATKDRSHFIAPMVFLKRQIGQAGDTADNTTLLLFNMLKAGDVPSSQPRGYRTLG